MINQTTELRKARQTAEREARIAEIMQEMTIDVDVFGAPFASVRNSKGNDYHIVSIDEETMTATKCTCDGYCKGHYYCVCMEAVDRFFEKIYASLHREASEVVELVPVEEAMEEAQAEMQEHELDTTYAQLAQERATAGIRAHLEKHEESNREACRNDVLTRDMQAAADAERRNRASLGGGRSFGSVLLNK